MLCGHINKAVGFLLAVKMAQRPAHTLHTRIKEL